MPEMANTEREAIMIRLLTYFAKEAGGELVIPIFELEELENEHLWLDHDTDAGVVKLVLIPDYIVSGIEAARKEEAELKRKEEGKQDELVKKAMKILSDTHTTGVTTSNTVQNGDTITFKYDVTVK